MKKAYIYLIIAAILLIILFGFVRKDSNDNSNSGSNTAEGEGAGSSGSTTGTTSGTSDTNAQAFNDISSLGNDLDSLESTASGLDQNVDITA